MILLDKKNFLLIILLSLMTLTFVNAATFDIPSGYQQVSSSVRMTELENNAGDYIIVADGDYISYEDLITQLGNDYVIYSVKNLEVDNMDVTEYRLSSGSSTKFVYSFKHYGHTYNIGVSTNNILFWNAESRSNPVYQIISSFS